MTNQPTPMLTSQVYACSVVGQVRDHNEDAVLATQWPCNQPGPLGLEALVAVADGMGGHERGEWASQTALSTFMEFLAQAPANAAVDQVVTDALVATNHAIYTGTPDSGASHPGTTFTVALVRGNVCTIGHVGDSRLYLLRAGEFTQITDDHSWAGELVRQGQMTPAQAANWAHKNQITRAIGIRATVEPALYAIELRKGDVLLLCSDGLSGMLTDVQIAAILAASSSASQAGEQLCAAANAAGGEDNISAVFYAHGSWPAPRHSHHASGPRSKTLTGAPKLSARLSAQYQGLRTWLMVIFAIGALVVLGVGIRLVLTRPTPPPHVKHAPIPAAATDAVLQKHAMLQVVWDKDQGVLTISVTDGQIKGLDLPDDRWDATQLSYRLTDQDQAALGKGTRLELQGMHIVVVDLKTTGTWTTPIDEAGAFAIKLRTKSAKTLAAFRIAMSK